MEFNALMEDTGKAVDAFGVAVIVVGCLVAMASLLRWALRRHATAEEYHDVRQSLGRSILLGLEFLIAGDIIRTVATTPTFRGVGILVAIILVRTFLSFTLELELTGRWPWDRGDDARGDADPPLRLQRDRREGG